MKKLILFIIAIVSFSSFSNAQTAQEIISRMEAVFEKNESGGLIMTLETKIPLMGETIAKTYSLGDKMRMETTMMGITVISWSDNETTWAYVPDANELEISKIDLEEAEEEGDDSDLFIGIGEGYNASISKETSEAWHLQCVKSKSNKDKDAPKKMELVVAKSTYMPISLSTKMMGCTIIMRDVSFGVSEKDVTFNIDDYPGVKIVDNR